MRIANDEIAMVGIGYEPVIEDAVTQTRKLLLSGLDPCTIYKNTVTNLLEIEKAGTWRSKDARYIRDLLETQILEWIEAEIKASDKLPPIYRRHAEILRSMIKAGNWHAKSLLRELLLEQTLPFNELESNRWGLVKGEWVELDSYTGEPMLDDPKIEAKTLGDRPAPQLPAVGDNLSLRIVEAYRKIGASEETITAAIEASRGYVDDEEEIWWEDRGITSEPIRQMKEQEARVDLDTLVVLRGEWSRFSKPRGQFIRSLINFLNHKAKEGYEPQYLFLLFARYQDDEKGVHSSFARQVQIPGWGNLYEWSRLFGDEILDEFPDAAWNPVPTSEGEILEIANHFEQEILANFPENAERISDTRSFMQGVFNALSDGKSDLTEGGYQNWRWQKSKIGALAFQRAIKRGIEGGVERAKAMKIAWKAFWQTGQITKIKKSGVTVNSAKGEEQLNWGLAAWRLAHGQIYLSDYDRERLRNILSDKGWGGKLIAGLSEEP